MLRLPKVPLYIRITSSDGKRRYERVNDRNPQIAQGRDTYCLHFYENGRRRWLTVGTDINVALAARFKKQTELRMGIQADPAAMPSRSLETLQQSISRYIEDIAAMKSERTASGYRYTLNEFAKTCEKPVSRITRDDLQKFAVAMKKASLSDRTIHNRLVEVVTFLRANGKKDVTLRWKYVEKQVKAYRPDELEKLFAARFHHDHC